MPTNTCSMAYEASTRRQRSMRHPFPRSIAGALLFANAILNVSPYLVRQSSILVIDHGCKVVKSCLRHGVKATNVRDAGALEDIQSLLDFRYLVASGTRVIDFPLQAQ